MTVLLKMTTVIITSLVIIIFCLSCKKNNSLPQPQQSHHDSLFKVALNNYLPYSNIDSALVKWHVNGTEQTITLQQKNDTLFTKLVPAMYGQATVTVKIFSKNKIDNKSLQYERRLSALVSSSGLLINGPSNIMDTYWNPRAIFYAQNQGNGFNVIVISGIRPSDPYFEFLNIDPTWRHRVTLERAYYKNTLAAPVATGIWDCNASCMPPDGKYKNENFFSFLPGQLNNHQWDRVEITLRLYRAPNLAGEMNFDHTF